MFLQILFPIFFSKCGGGGGGRCHNLKNGKEAREDTEESPAGCTGEGKIKEISRRE